MPKDEALARTRKAPDYLAARLICSAAGPLSGIDIPDAMSRKCSAARSFPRPPSATALPSPHSMNASTARSFLSVVVNDKPMAWGTQKVSLIMLMGLSEADRKGFRVLFDSLLEVLSDPAKVTQLTRSNTYDEFAGVVSRKLV